jgi:hypothetical protein
MGTPERGELTFAGERYERATDAQAYWGSMTVQAVVATFLFAVMFWRAIANLLH